MQKIGIMGGTFNPIHMGHLILAEKAREQFHLDEVIFIPCGVPYMKNTYEILPGEIRAEMTKLAVVENPFFDVSMIEIERKGNTYTYETLLSLRDKNPGAEYYFILGADSLFAIENWKMPEKIFENCHILVAVRDEKTDAKLEEQITYLCQKYNASISLLQTVHIAISSSMIRDALKDGKSIRYLIPDAVYDYIIKNKLYKADET